MKERIFNHLVDYIQTKLEVNKELSLLEISPSLRYIVDRDFPHHNLNFEEKRGLCLDAYDYTHPNTPARRFPETPKPFEWRN